MSKQLLETFYTAFSKRDWATMQTCYHDEARFSDPAFLNLDANEVRAMWRMLCEGGKDLSLRFENIKTSEFEGKSVGSLTWIADYTFSQTGNKVNNIINASFVFKDGKILEHQDSFDFYRWSRQAMGFKGVLLGWTPFFKDKVQQIARQRLTKFMKK